MKVSDEIVERIRKCLALANGLNATPGEIETALMKAKKIAMRYSIDLSSIGVDEEEKATGDLEVTQDKELKTRSKFRQPYHDWILTTLRAVFGVRPITVGHNTYNGFLVIRFILVGAGVDVAIAKEVFFFLEKFFPKTLNRAIKEGKLRECAAHINGYYNGLYKGIVEANRREEAALPPEDSSKWALVVRNKSDAIDLFIRGNHPNLKTPKYRAREYSDRAASLGYQEGRKINLHQIKSASNLSNQLH